MADAVQDYAVKKGVDLVFLALAGAVVVTLVIIALGGNFVDAFSQILSNI